MIHDENVPTGVGNTAPNQTSSSRSTKTVKIGTGRSTEVKQTTQTAGTPKKIKGVFEHADTNAPLASSKKLSLSSHRAEEAVQKQAPSPEAVEKINQIKSHPCIRSNCSEEEAARELKGAADGSIILRQNGDKIEFSWKSKSTIIHGTATIDSNYFTSGEATHFVNDTAKNPPPTLLLRMSTQQPGKIAFTGRDGISEAPYSNVIGVFSATKESADKRIEIVDDLMRVPEHERPETAALVNALARNTDQSVDTKKEILEAVRSAKNLFTPDMSITDKQKIVDQVLKIPKEHRSNAIKIAEENSSFFNGNTGVRVRSKPEMLEAIAIAFDSLQNLFTENMSDQNKREIISKGTEALSSLLSGKGTLTPKEMNTKLAQYNDQLEKLKFWEAPTVPSLFTNISSPTRTQLSSTKPVHGNWLNGEKSFAGFMYPTRETAPAMLETLMSAKIDRHVQLANPFVVWLQHPETGPVFPMSTEAFEQCQKNPVRTIQTERGPITVTYGKVETDDSGQKVGTFTIASERDRVTRECKWPLDSLTLKDDLRIELQSTGNFDTYVYKNGSGDSVHSLQVGQLHWNDMEGTSLLELHKNASWLAEADNRSVNCRAGVGRTGTLFVATMMREWVKDHPGEALTQATVLKMIAEGRRNRDPQVVQTESQIKLLNDYMLYLNCNNLPFEEAIVNLSRAPETAEGSNHYIGKNLKESGVRDILTKKERTAEDEAKLDQFYSDNSVCPITLESFKDPVVLNSGRTYERSAIERWRREGKTTCPMTRIAITEVKEDIFTKSLMALIGNRALETLPTTEKGKAAFEQIQQILVKEPHHWCRVLSAVMPKNSYIVREKGMGGANEFVIELRGKTRVQKCSFSVNAEGLLQPGGQSDVSFKTPDQLAAWLIGADKTNALNAPPKMLTEEAISDLNARMGKAAFMANRFVDATLMTIIDHFEQQFEDGKVSSEVVKAGYVRAGQLPSSFPCFTHVRGNNKNRYCLSGGQVCAVGAITVEGKNKEQCIEVLRKANLSQEQKEAYLSELDKVASELTYSSPITLFIPTTNAIKPESLSLATINAAQKKAKTVLAYTGLS